MPKRRTQDSDNWLDAEDNPIGLTGAFAPVKGPQSVDYDTNDDPVGLTQAFGAVPSQDEPRAWDEAGKWKDFDWDAALGEPAGDYGADGEEAGEDAPAKAADRPAESAGSDRAGQDDRAVDAAEQTGLAASAGAAYAAAKGDAASAADNAASSAVSSASNTSNVAPASPSAKKGASRGRHAAPEPEVSPRMKKSQRTRRVLIVLVILLALALVAVGFFGYRTWVGSQQEAAQQAQEQVSGSASADDIADAPADDAHEAQAKLADVPDLSGVLGKGQDEAIAAIGRGAVVTANREVNEEGNPIKANLNVALTDEPADSKTGTPTVYLGISEDGKVLQAGYSASAAALGFGALSFADAVSNEHVVEKTLAKIGVSVPEGSAVLPAKKKDYSTYASDGTTVIRERASFDGDVTVAGVPCTWSAVLSYDYTTQVVTGNLNDTVRIIYVYVTAK